MLGQRPPGGKLPRSGPRNFTPPPNGKCDVIWQKMGKFLGKNWAKKLGKKSENLGRKRLHDLQTWRWREGKSALLEVLGIPQFVRSGIPFGEGGGRCTLDNVFLWNPCRPIYPARIPTRKTPRFGSNIFDFAHKQEVEHKLTGNRETKFMFAVFCKAVLRYAYGNL